MQSTKASVDSLFMNQSQLGRESFQAALHTSIDSLLEQWQKDTGPYSGILPGKLAASVESLFRFQPFGESIESVFQDIKEYLLPHLIDVSHPKCLAHLHCPPLIPALAAEVMVSSFNQSMDSFDQSGIASLVEEEILKWLCAKFSYGGLADGTFTSGGTQSNYMGLLLARDAFCENTWQWNVQQKGLPSEAHRMRILCSKNAHFTVKKSASQLGLGEQAVVLVETDEHHRMDLNDLKKKMVELKDQNLLPFAVVATCGTTDFGSIDPVRDVYDIVKPDGLWIHADAAYGGALVLSETYRSKLAGMELADSITIDFHKQFYQPISCGAFLLKDKRHFGLIDYHADYLNPKEDELDGILHLVNKSIQTTRRFDALKLLLSLRLIGEEGFGDIIDHTIHFAKDVAALIERNDHLEVINPEPEINAIVFRFKDEHRTDDINKIIHRTLFKTGTAVIAKTVVDGRTCLKFTLLNPRTTITHIEEILSDIVDIGIAHIQSGRVLR
ncbi:MULTISPECIES: pyridoxal phosphate-dependent decarboxylase family protein [Bacillus]|jgi:L-2,4-diaminobutyrate decarboxylase|uniref:pyridoxal phosphate-dependent decarboxylase family protein n=1 Tax=Bacillus TaxID=1386 RepID=UPI00081FF3CB|nr:MULTISPECIES: aspartate aminotransferase family protein [Bacillus]AOC57228.1 2,4-diaminobutyrate decarboxylase [Bacillus pumilus]MBR0587600.1 aspartate aminotransferase family protein [Bacillus pumilus DW2J2]MBR0617394.1 aspartate aminotransferase family protein [Bacillus pumilus]MBR0622910.1 aspartate aminotransferase family protein [Bacillus pumilus]MCY7725069.1 aspartate aminotransferase family protein [Bacillus pumilus]